MKSEITIKTVRCNKRYPAGLGRTETRSQLRSAARQPSPASVVLAGRYSAPTQPW